MRASWVVIIAAKSEIALFVDVYFERVPAGYDHPHANVKLPIHDQHRILDILLDDPGLFGVSLPIAVQLITADFVHVVLRIDLVLVRP